MTVSLEVVPTCTFIRMQYSMMGMDGDVRAECGCGAIEVQGGVLHRSPAKQAAARNKSSTRDYVCTDHDRHIDHVAGLECLQGPDRQVVSADGGGPRYHDLHQDTNRNEWRATRVEKQ